MLTKEMRGDAFLRQLPSDIRASFTSVQEAAIRATAIKTGPSVHPIDYRLSVTLPAVGRLYLVLLAGREKRNPTRLALEAALRPSKPLTRAVIFGIFITAFSIAALTAMLLYGIRG
ncbi:hypothetical protein ACFPL7_21985 [Dongia soli]|uniref:Uncharacterized protein n=1 Tax=Dongia soli TaxID=600628 RepID=A0ABU5E8S2_9PROT|nr:hypothetical protein [Dongia soli]MDY0882261.1 hypothetical protein [Dongia soli]